MEEGDLYGVEMVKYDLKLHLDRWFFSVMFLFRAAAAVCAVEKPKAARALVDIHASSSDRPSVSTSILETTSMQPMAVFNFCLFCCLLASVTLVNVSAFANRSGTSFVQAAVAQELERVVWQQGGCWFDPRCLLTKCRGVPEQDT